MGGFRAWGDWGCRAWGYSGFRGLRLIWGLGPLGFGGDRVVSCLSLSCLVVESGSTGHQFEMSTFPSQAMAASKHFQDIELGPHRLQKKHPGKNNTLYYSTLIDPLVVALIDPFKGTLL